MARAKRPVPAGDSPPAAPAAAGRNWRILLLAALPIAAAFYLGIVIGVLAAGLSLEITALILGLPLALVAGLLVGRVSSQSAAAIGADSGLTGVREAIVRVAIRLDRDQPERIEIIHPGFDPEGGPAEVPVLNLARRLIERGHRTRLILLDGEHLTRDWRKRLARHPEIGPVTEDLELTVAGEGRELALSPEDRVIATDWRSAHAADRLCLDLPASGFTYLIREYEPFLYPMGSFAALADASYELPHRAIFLDPLLREYFADQRLGVFAAGPRLGLRETFTTREPILPIRARTADQLAAADRHRLLISSRPGEDGAGSLYELAVTALDRAVLNGHFRGWDLAAFGVDGEDTAIVLPRSSARLRVLPGETAAIRAGLMPDFDVGVALRYAPGLGPVPIGMAAAAMSVVTATFAEKDRAALAGISPNLIPAEPRIEAIIASLGEAERRTRDLDGRLEGAGIEWPSSWSETLDDPAMEAIEELVLPL